MALREIGATLRLDGEKAFKKGINDAARGLRVLDSELKASSAGFAGQEKSLQSLTAKGQIFEKRVKQQKEVINALARAVKESGEMYGESSAKTDGYRIKLNNATAALAKMERELEQNSQAMSELGSDTSRAAKMMDKLERKAKEMNASLRKAGEGLGNVGQKMAMGVTAPVIAGIGLATEGTRDFRMDMARLDTNARAVGQDMGVLDKAMAKLYGITGEVDSNVEGLSNILATGFRDDSILKITEGLAGAAIKWSDTLKFEGLADGLQETLATGKSIGPFDEMLSRAGVNLDNWNLGLQEAIKKGTQQQYVLQTLADLGLPAVYEGYRRNNRELVEAGEKSYEFQRAMGDLGNKLDPILTKVITVVTKLIDKFNALSPTSQDLAIKIGLIAAAVGPVLAAIGKAMVFVALFGDKLGGLTKIITSTAGFVTRFGGVLLNLATKIGPLVIQFAARIGPVIAGLANPVGIAVAAVVGLIAIFAKLWQTSPKFRAWVREIGQALENGWKDIMNNKIKELNWFIDQLNRLPKVNIGKLDYMVKDSGTSGFADFRQLDRYAGGTNYHPGGLAWVGEKGPELVNLPRGSQVLTNQQSMAMAGGGPGNILGTVIHQFQTNDKSIVTKFAEEIRQGNRRLPQGVTALPFGY